jgi:hypothetical protein
MGRLEGRRAVITGVASGIGEATVDGAMAAAVESFGGLDCLFNNAGNPGSTGGIEEVDMAMFDRTVDGGRPRARPIAHDPVRGGTNAYTSVICADTSSVPACKGTTASGATAAPSF